ncbi:efflux RND transporter periplasmic adaptor subunit [Caldinitratiruptor microaerophilus]|uniref:RND family efflux transporter, MFP subunit n=1 Tax=Caldinitratiruptor microaerophilus TaxID=671077 RepID=A0AA35CJ93_9FIRM|nr:efflux RND transporter periplasmic adaptor subunit [Caldinitratiruptor microaerophilus]BDG60227.1 hypothetical protein caldi_13170 [Caldinitratiruptor microaerophilus]
MVPMGARVSSRRVRQFAYVALPSVAVIALLGWQLANRASRTAAPAGLVTVPVRRGSIELTVSGTGTLEAGQRANITAEVSGTVVAVNFVEGDTVRKGQTLIELRNDDLVAQVEQARLSLAAAENRLYQRLGIPEGSPLDLSEALTVRAPVSGRLSRLEVKRGDRVSAGQPVAWVASGEQLLFRARVNRVALPFFHTGQAARVRLDAFDGELTGTVVAVASEPARSGGVESYDVDVALDETGVLGAGYAGQLTVEVPQGSMSFSGQTVWGQEQVVTARAAGVVREVLVSEGRRVTAGQVVMRLENPTLPQEVRAEQIAVEQARETLAQREQNLAKLKIVAPIDGVVTARDVAVGDTVGTGQNGARVLATIVDTSVLTLTLQVDELDVPRLRPGQPASVVVNALPGRTLTGRVEKIAGEGTVQNGVTIFAVTITVPGQPDIRPGMTASASVRVAAKDGVLVVPAEAVERQGGRAFVQVPEGDQVVRRPIRTGLENEQVVEVLEGLAEGDTVVVARRPAGSGTQGAGFRPPGTGGFGLPFGPGGGQRPAGGQPHDRQAPQGGGNR